MKTLMQTWLGFFYLLKDFNKPLWDGCINHSKLSTFAQVFTIKSDHGLSEFDYDIIVEWSKSILLDYDIIVEWSKSILLERNKLGENFYAIKSMMKPFGLGYHKINICPNFCMLYYLENTYLIMCRTCGYTRYKPIIDRERTLVTHIKLRYFSITHRL
jgi:hypothetical protein